MRYHPSKEEIQAFQDVAMCSVKDATHALIASNRREQLRVLRAEAGRAAQRRDFDSLGDVIRALIDLMVEDAERGA